MRRQRTRRVQPVKPASREPKTDREWRTLMRKVITRAEQNKDPRLPLLKRAVTDGTIAKVLKRMRIICDTDIHREFPSL